MPTAKYLFNEYNYSSSTYYGIITTVPAWLKKANVKISGTISVGTDSSATGWISAATGALYMKINNGTEVLVKQGGGSSSVGGSMSASVPFEETYNLSSATKIAFKFVCTRSTAHQGSGGPSSFSPLFGWKCDFGFVVPNLDTETFISAGKVNEIASFLGANASAAAGNSIIKTPYATLATSAGITAFDATYPKAADLTRLVNAVNGKTVSRSWDSTNSSDY